MRGLTAPALSFIVLGLPRSGTTWLANWLTTDRSLCLHDPFALGTPEYWPRDERPLGISCTGAYLFPRWLAQQQCPMAIIERDPGACDASLARMGLGNTEHLRHALANTPGRRWAFDDLWNESTACELWGYLLPRTPFDAIRYRLLRHMQVQPHMSTWRFDPTTYTEMQRREAGG